MTCEHCCYNSQDHGEFMDMDTFKSAIRWNCGLLNIGGGEPSIHPKIIHMVETALDNGHRIWMVINGKKKDCALKLAKMSKEFYPKLRCKLSQDQWHEPISDEVVSVFKNLGMIHRVKRPIIGGRWQGQISDITRDCCQNSNKPFIQPDGSVYQCGCEGAACIGNVFDGFYPINGKWACYYGKQHTEKSQKGNSYTDVHYNDPVLDDLARRAKERFRLVGVESVLHLGPKLATKAVA